MNNTESNLNQSGPIPTKIFLPKEFPRNLPFEVERDLNKYPRIFVTKQYDPFKITNCCESLKRDYIIFGDDKNGVKNLLFTCYVHEECCNCYDQCIIGGFCCAFACCDSILFQLDYRKDDHPFYTQGFNVSKGCHCCDFLACPCYCCCACVDKLYLRENYDPDSPDKTVGAPKGRTETNCCCSCDRFVDYFPENNLKDQTVRVACCDLCCNACCAGLCCCCFWCIQGGDIEMSIEDQNGAKTGNVLIYSGCCSRKVEDKKCCSFPRDYFDANMPPNATSRQKFQVIADIIHLDLVNNII